MRLLTMSGSLTLLATSLLFASCGGDGGGDGGRTPVRVTMTERGCLPNPIPLKPGEKVTFEIQNDSKSDQEFEGIDGTKLEEVIVPTGRTRKVDYTAPSKPGTQKVKCYVPGGASFIVDLIIAN